MFTESKLSYVWDLKNILCMVFSLEVKDSIESVFAFKHIKIVPVF